MDKNSNGPNNNDFEVINDHVDETTKLNTSAKLSDDLHINKIDNVYNYSYENLNSSPQERIPNLDNAETKIDFNYVNSSIETQKPYKKPNKKKKSNFFKYFFTGLMCSIISIILSVAIMLYVIPQSEFYKDSSLSKELDNKIDSKVSSAVEKSQALSQLESATGNTSLTISEIASKVSPAVVGISKGTISNSHAIESFGSGVIFREDGYILTNYHVIQNAINNKVRIVFHDEKTAQAKIVNFNKDLDIAVVKVDGIEMPGVATLGDSSNLKTGELALAFGSPLGIQYLGSVSAGIISSPSRLISVTQNSKAHVIQTDAAINPGNSGGPLVDSNGQVIGINSAKINEIDGTKVEGMGFAIPINEIKPLLDQNAVNNIIVDNPNIVFEANLNQTEEYKGVLLGVFVQYISGDIAKEHNCPDGLQVSNFTENSAAHKAGIKQGDVILSVGGKKVKDVSEIKQILKDMKLGDKIDVQIQENLNVPPKNIIVTF